MSESSERDARAGDATPPLPSREGLGEGRTSTSLTAIPPADDLHDSSIAFDPSQWAMHGLLSIYFDPARDNVDQRVHDLVRAVLGRARGPGRRGWLVRLVSPRLWVGPGRVRTIFGRTLTRRQALGGSPAAAAVILLAVLLTVSPRLRNRVAVNAWPSVPSFDARCDAAMVQPMPMGCGLNDRRILCGVQFDKPPAGTRRSGQAQPGRYMWGAGSQPVGWGTGYQPVSLLADWVRDLDCGIVDDRLDAIEAIRRQRDAYLAEI